MLMRINSIIYNKSVVDGPGIRTVLFVQGCDLRCKGCQNKSTWDFNKGKEIDINDLVNELNEKVFNKKITISGGEPLMQKEALINLVTKLNDLGFDIALYTGHQKEDVPSILVEKVKYLKTGNFIQKLKTTITPFVGSSNQVFEEVK
ncbi:MAG: radical SAM protein [Erysipelotrichaceae bacterium]|nr:radical SAM protein [Erysipelotrichaceae bacterium]